MNVTSTKSGTKYIILRSLSLRRASGGRTPLIIDVNIGSNAEIFKSYLGVIKCEKTFIFVLSWDHVFEVD